MLLLLEVVLFTDREFVEVDAGLVARQRSHHLLKRIEIRPKVVCAGSAAEMQIEFAGYPKWDVDEKLAGVR